MGWVGGALVALCALATQGAEATEATEASEETKPPVEAAAPVTVHKIVVLDLEASGVDPSQAELVNGVIAQTLAPYATLEVVTTGDIRRVADLEAQKQALGCDQDSCLAEIAGALGAQYVIFGRIGQLDQTLIVQLNLFDAEAAKPVAREDLRAKNLDEIVDNMGTLTRRLTLSLLPEGTEVEEPTAAPSDDGDGLLTLTLRWGGAGLAGVALTVGAIATTVAAVEVGIVSNSEAAAKSRNDGKLVGAAMVITAAVSGVIAAVGLGAFGVSFIDLE